MLTYEELENRFKHHPPKTTSVGEAHSSIRIACLSLAEHLMVIVPEGREQDLAIEKLEEVMFWANAGIARK